MARQRLEYTTYQEILNLREQWSLVEYRAARGSDGPAYFWLVAYPGEYDSTTEPTEIHDTLIFRWWFSDPDTAFAFKMRWV